MNILELYLWGVIVVDFEYLDCLVFDFDFGEGVGWVEVKVVVCDVCDCL